MVPNICTAQCGGKEYGKSAMDDFLHYVPPSDPEVEKTFKRPRKVGKHYRPTYGKNKPLVKAFADLKV